MSSNLILKSVMVR